METAFEDLVKNLARPVSVAERLDLSGGKILTRPDSCMSKSTFIDWIAESAALFFIVGCWLAAAIVLELGSLPPMENS